METSDADELKTALTMDELHEIGEDMLDFFDRFCAKKGLRFWLAYGTLLGAVRHEGPIPWDEDVDVYMPIDDFVRLAGMWDELQDGDIVLQCHESDPRYQLDPMRLRKRGTYYPTRPSVNCGWKEQGAWVDIYPLYPQKRVSGFGAARFKLSAALNTMTYHRLYDRDTYFRNASKASLAAHRFAMAVSRILPLRCWMALRRSVRKCGSAIIGDDRYYTQHCQYGYRKGTFDIDWFSETARLKYGDHAYPVPGGWHELLTHVYGDYMTPVVRESALFTEEVRDGQA